MSAKLNTFEKVCFVASDTAEAQEAAERLRARYGNHGANVPDVIVALGGDGLMLQTLHAQMGNAIPIYGMNRGSVGFLMNEFAEDDLIERLAQAKSNVIHPLRIHVIDQSGAKHEALAINEASLFRQSYQAARLRIAVDGKVRMEDLICDGVLVATPAGSTAYNLSAHGPILPIDSPLLALTPISPFRPRAWRGALLPNAAIVTITVLEGDKRPVSAVADHTEFKSVDKVDVAEDSAIDLLMLFDPGHALDERILVEQFRF